MNKTISLMSKMTTLVKREFWEQRILFLYMPVIVILLVTIAFAISTMRAYNNDYHVVTTLAIGFNPVVESATEALADFAALPEENKARFWNIFYLQSMPILFIAFWGTMIYYFLMTLYQQRKDRSILFWNSMPVSDAETIFSKVVAGLVLCHGIFLICLLLLHLLLLLILSVYGSFFELDVWATFVAPANIFSRFFQFAGFSMLALLWSLPVYAWFLLASAWSRSAPFAWAMGPVVILVIGELIIYGELTIFAIFVEHMIPVFQFYQGPEGYTAVIGNILNLEMVLGILLGCVFLYAAIRFNRSEEC